MSESQLVKFLNQIIFFLRNHDLCFLVPVT